MLKKALQLTAVTVFAASSIACGDIEALMTLALDEGSSMQISLNPDTPNPVLLGTVDLEGGVDTVMTAEIDLFALLFAQPIIGAIEVEDLLFAGTPFDLLGIPTDEVCVIKDPNGASGGTALIDLFDHQPNNASLQFMIDLASRIRVGNPFLAGAIPEGFPLVLEVDSEADLSLAEMLSLISGSGDGGFSVTQELDEQFDVDVAGIPLSLGVTGELSLSTVNEFPTGPLLDDCIALLGL